MQFSGATPVSVVRGHSQQYSVHQMQFLELKNEEQGCQHTRQAPSALLVLVLQPSSSYFIGILFNFVLRSYFFFKSQVFSK